MAFDWKTYCITEPFDKDDRKNTSFTQLFHVAHVGDARRVLEDGVMRAQLVQDKSKLNASRARVVWTSPNTWVQGSLYGGVSFSLDVPDALPLTAHFYKVEVMQEYTPHANRILVSATPVLFEGLEEFNPNGFGHPIHRTEAGIWYRLSRYNYEIMLARDVAVSASKRLEFVDHHPTLCNKLPGACTERGHSAEAAARELLAWIIGTGHKHAANLLLDGNGRTAAVVPDALEWLARQLGAGPKVIDPDPRPDRLRAAILAYGHGHHELGVSAMGRVGALGTSPPEELRPPFLQLIRALWGDAMVKRVETGLDSGN